MQNGKWIKYFSLVVVLCFSVTMTACGTTKVENNVTKAAEQTPTASEKAKQPVKLKAWFSQNDAARSKISETLIKDFQDKNKDIQIEYEFTPDETYKVKFKAAVASNEMPDVFSAWSGTFMDPIINSNKVLALNDLMKKNNWDSKYIEGPLVSTAVNGKNYLLPGQIDIVTMFYNKEIFKKYNLSEPKTFDDLVTASKTLATNKINPIALGNKEKWTGSMLYIYMVDRSGGLDPFSNVIKGTGTFSDPAFVNAGKKIQELVDAGAFGKNVNGTDYGQAESSFISGQSAMYLMGTWCLPNLLKPENKLADKLGSFKVPYITGSEVNQDFWLGGIAGGIGISASTKDPETAFKFASLYDEAYSKKMFEDTKAVIVPYKSEVDTKSLHEAFANILTGMKTSKGLSFFYDLSLDPKTAEVHKNLIQELFGKLKTPEQFVEEHNKALKANAK